MRGVSGRAPVKGGDLAKAAALYDEIAEHWTIAVGAGHSEVQACKADAARVRAAVAQRRTGRA